MNQPGHLHCHQPCIPIHQDLSTFESWLQPQTISSFLLQKVPEVRHWSQVFCHRVGSFQAKHLVPLLPWSDRQIERGSDVYSNRQRRCCTWPWCLRCRLNRIWQRILRACGYHLAPFRAATYLSTCRVWGNVPCWRWRPCLYALPSRWCRWRSHCWRKPIQASTLRNHSTSCSPLQRSCAQKRSLQFLPLPFFLLYCL